MKSPDTRLLSHATFAFASRLLAIVGCLALGACATGRISPADRAAIKTVRTVDPATGAEAKLYADSTGAVTTRVLTPFGFVGGLLAAGIVESNRNAGIKRWQGVLAGREAQVLGIVRQKVEQKFAEGAGLRFTRVPPADADFQFETVQFGIQHQGDQQFSVLLTAHVKITRPGGKVVWQLVGGGGSQTRRKLEQFQAEPATFTAAMEEAADALAKQLLERF